MDATTVKVPIIQTDCRSFNSEVYLTNTLKADKPLYYGKKSTVCYGDSKPVRLSCMYEVKKDEISRRESDIIRLFKIHFRKNKVIMKFNTCTPRHLMLASADLLLFIEMDEKEKFRTVCKSSDIKPSELYREYCLNNTVEDLMERYSENVVKIMNNFMSRENEGESVKYVFYNNIKEDSLIDKTVGYSIVKLIRIGRYLRDELWYFDRGRCQDNDYQCFCMMYRITCAYFIKFLNSIPVVQAEQCTALNLYTQYYNYNMDVSTKLYGTISEINTLYDKIMKRPFVMK